MKLTFAKFFILFIVLGLTACSKNSNEGIHQNIVEVLYVLPNDVDLPNSQEDLEKAINAFFNRNNNTIEYQNQPFAFHTIDLKFGKANYSSGVTGESYLNGSVQILKTSAKEYLIARYYSIFNLNDQPETKLQFYTYDGSNITPVSTKELLPKHSTFKNNTYDLEATSTRCDSLELIAIKKSIANQGTIVNFVNLEIEGKVNEEDKSKKMTVNKIEISLSPLTGLSKETESKIVYSANHGTSVYIFKDGQFIEKQE